MLQIDNTGQIRLPGRVNRDYSDSAVPGTAAPASWLAVSAGTYTTPSGWSGTSIGAATVLSAATNGSAAAMKGAAPLNAINPANFQALRLTLESLKASVDSGADFEMGFQSSLGGATLLHLNGALTAVVRVRDATGAITDFPTNYTFFQANGGGRYRRNLTILILPFGYVGDARASFFVLEDDALVAAVDIFTVWTLASTVVPLFQVISRTAAAVSMSYANVKMTINHN